MTDTPDAPDSRIDLLQAMLDRAAEALGEQLDGVQIVATYSEGDTTTLLSAGSGSFHARWAACREQVLIWDEQAREAARMNLFEQDEDTDE
jgi:hypothetical protein